MSRTFTREDTRKLAAVLAETALAEVMPRYRNLPEGAVRGKSSPRDLVTDADEAAERLIAARLAKLHPGAVLIGEEASARNPALLNMLVDADLAFLIDPIDGTRNYVADPALAAALLGWRSTHDVAAMCADGWRWQQGNPQGYEAIGQEPPKQGEAAASQAAA